MIRGPRIRTLCTHSQSCTHLALLVKKGEVAVAKGRKVLCSNLMPRRYEHERTPCLGLSLQSHLIFIAVRSSLRVLSIYWPCPGERVRLCRATSMPYHHTHRHPT